MIGYRRVLIAVNGSEEALKQGVKHVKDEKNWITVVKVVEPYEGDLYPTDIKKAEQQL